MRSRILHSLFLLICISVNAGAQEFSYTQYNVKDGLAGSTVYCIAQDKDGFLWMGTETGISRFDGTHFFNLSGNDGLPDVEILKIFPDSKGRVWMAPFKKSICYYYKGKIHNQENDSILGKIQLRGNIEQFAEDNDGNILIKERTILHLLLKDGKMLDFYSINGSLNPNLDGITVDSRGKFLVMDNGILFEFSNGKFRKLNTLGFRSTTSNMLAMGREFMAWRSRYYEITARKFTSGEERKLKFSLNHVSMNILDDSLLFDNKSNGTFSYNMRTGDMLDSFIVGSAVSYVFKDSEKNIWFATLGEGIFKLNSQNFRRVAIPIGNIKHVSIHAISKIKSKLYVGTNLNSISVLNLPDCKLESNHFLFKEGEERILMIDTLGNNDIIEGSDVGIAKLWNDFSLKISEFQGRLRKMVLKGVYKKNEHEWYVATSFNVLKFDPARFLILDTIWHERTTAVFLKKDTFYIGTLNGLYQVYQDKTYKYLGKNYPAFRKRISGIIQSPDGTLLIATYDSGIIGFRDDKVIYTLDESKGLTSNVCKTIYLHKNDLWVGTDKGLNEIDLTDSMKQIKTYTSFDGLASDIVNSVLVDSNMVYAGTPAGLSFFDKSKIDNYSICLLHFLDIQNSGNKLAIDSDNYIIDWNKNNIRFNFAGISFKSGGKLQYHYRLIGLDSNWKKSKESFLEYPTLPAGKYQLEVFAVNKFGIRSSALIKNFVVGSPIWKNSWFLAISVLLLIGLGVFLISRRFKLLRKRHNEKESISRKMIELEHMAVRSQMNPHFIFNCLNSIQQYIFNRDVVEANKYISDFAKLIRATLQNSSQTYVSVAEELDYITTYMNLEKSRFKENLFYTIEIEQELNSDMYYLPSMILQPFLENSIRHGIRHKKEGDGMISIALKKQDEQLICIITDNGVGRKKAGEYKALDRNEYQSKGMYLTNERIKLLNTVFHQSNPIQIQVIDLETAQHLPCGTKVILKFPLVDEMQKHSL